MIKANTSMHGNEKENINRDEFCRHRCDTAAEREAAIDRIPSLTPQERGEPVPEEAPPPHLDPALTEP
jgi:hypothetical protein